MLLRAAHLARRHPALNFTQSNPVAPPYLFMHPIRRLLFCLLLAMACLPAAATHIVGGEIVLEQLSGNTSYRLTLNLYFDNINGSTGAIDPDATISVFAKSTNTFVTSYELPLISSQGFIPNTNPNCTLGTLSTRTLFYAANITFGPFASPDPQGYYFSYERCCRNGVITNILAPNASGQTFYMEHPGPQLATGAFRKNSTPVFRQPRNDYICANTPFSLDFSALDVDGDSLVYSLTNPLQGNSSPIDPRPLFALPAPYDSVNWVAGFDRQNQIKGSQPLGIDPRTGRLSVVAGLPGGLHVFAIKVEEFRQGIRLGEVRREYQLMVLDCPPTYTPQLVVEDPVQNRAVGPGDTIRIAGDYDACLNLLLTALLGPTQTGKQVQVTAKALNFVPLAPLLSTTTVNIASSTDTSRLRLCLPRCSGRNLQVLHLRLSLADNSCPQPRRDSIEVFIKINKPRISNPMVEVRGTAFASNTKRITVAVPLRKPRTFALSVIDSTLQLVRIRVRQVHPTSEQVVLTNSKPRLQTLDFTPTISCSIADGGDSLVYMIYGERSYCDTITLDSTLLVVRPFYDNQPVQVSSSTGPLPLDRLLNISLAPNRDTLITLNVFDPDTTGFTSSLVWTADTTTLPGTLINNERTINSQTWSLRVAANCEAMYLPQPFTYKFKVREEYCIERFEDSLTIQVFMKDFDEVAYKPVNTITPNGDGMNDALVLASLVPPNNCTPDEVEISIINRWGQRLFQSRDRYFRWEARDIPAGVYFYTLRLNNRLEKGWLQVLH